MELTETVVWFSGVVLVGDITWKEVLISFYDLPDASTVVLGCRKEESVGTWMLLKCSAQSALAEPAVIAY